MPMWILASDSLDPRHGRKRRGFENLFTNLGIVLTVSGSGFVPDCVVLQELAQVFR